MDDGPLIQHLGQITGLAPALLGKILDEVHAWFALDLEAWVRCRHRELRQQGLRNAEIYPRLQAEAQGILVRPGPLSERQIRRIIYG
jgi:hypothetical protein